jgi:Tfp pilus assembly protein PilX
MFNTEKGTILYFSILILSVIFAIAMGLALIVFSQFRIQREIGYSVIALCAADTGVERALYEIYTTTTENPFSFSFSNVLLDNGATFSVHVYPSSSVECDPTTQYYCIKSQGVFGGVIRAVDASY